jgi:Ca2+-binding EF-hand superfamily protein
MFDTDNSGEIDEDEFGLLLEYMGIELSEAEMERLFKRFDTVRQSYCCPYCSSYKER